jgi:hypothetical protein
MTHHVEYTPHIDNVPVSPKESEYDESIGLFADHCSFFGPHIVMICARLYAEGDGMLKRVAWEFVETIRSARSRRLLRNATVS